jgi:multiple sugar transport system permease protein
LGSIINSILVAIATVVGTVVVSTLAAYGFERCRFPGSDALFLVLIATLMIPFQSILTPLFELLHVIHLVNSLVGLALVYITFQLPFALFVMRNAIASVPKELEEAAAVDGASILGILIRVVIPLARPGIITVGLFAFFASWNEFMAALILMTDQSNFTLPVTLNTVVTGSFGVINWGLLEAGVVVAMLPCAVIFILLQRYYFKGMMSGAFK